jgi:hypothetical protein
MPGWEIDIEHRTISLRDGGAGAEPSISFALYQDRNGRFGLAGGHGSGQLDKIAWMTYAAEAQRELDSLP